MYKNFYVVDLKKKSFFVIKGCSGIFDDTVSPKIVIYWKSLFLVVVWLSPSTHLYLRAFCLTIVNRVK